MPLADAVRRRRRELITTVVERLVADLSPYGSLPDEELTGEIAAAVDRGLGLFLTVLAEQRPLTDSELRDLGDSAARRAEERVPLESVLTAYLLGVRTILAELTAELRADEGPDLLRSIDDALAFLEAATAVIVRRYLAEGQTIRDVRQDAAQALLSQLLTGAVRPDPSPIAATAYVVLRLHVGPSPDEQVDRVDRQIAAERKLRRLRAELDRATEGQALASIGATGGIVLLPRSTATDEFADDEWATLRSLVADLTGATRADITATAVPAEAAAVPGAAALAADLLALVERLGRGPGLHRLSDVTVEFQLGQPGPARRLLAAHLDPLVGRDDLVTTLRAYLRTGSNRRKAALDLGVHPNTVDHRLRRVANSIGLDPTDPRQSVQLAAALMAHDAEAAERAAPPAPS